MSELDRFFDDAEAVCNWVRNAAVWALLIGVMFLLTFCS